ncbi:MULTISPECIES: DMT family transporter [Actinomycetes]|uniref:DMT family transporter n=1 Tax=Actinomycetes TaxID=1760 RepID=UPI000A1FAFBC|nr:MULTISPECIES: DMT family transporter [Streptomyces]MYR03414.1 hypothetical protein [Streptomyces sp. SID6139]TGZ14568.1 membrane protein [Streptomyces sp. S816]WDO04427.1 DMT family transporter [Streptomyces murinus]
MLALPVGLALCSALANAASSVLQRRAAAVDTPAEPGGPGTLLRGLRRLLRRPDWLAGVALLMLSAVMQGWALAVGSLSLVQPLLATELLFTLIVGGLVFRRRPGGRTWLAFVALAVGLAVFLLSAAPRPGRDDATSRAWLMAGGVACAVVLLLVLAARTVRGPARAALLGLASAVSFATTAALLKESVGRLRLGPGVMFSHWSPYATAAVGLVAFLLLQSALGAGSLAASQPALTLGDALTSVALGWALFEESVQLGLRMIPEAIGIVLIGAGSIGLANTLSAGRGWDAPAEPDGSEVRTRRE